MAEAEAMISSEKKTKEEMKIIRARAISRTELELEGGMGELGWDQLPFYIINQMTCTISIHTGTVCHV